MAKRGVFNSNSGYRQCNSFVVLSQILVCLLLLITSELAQASPQRNIRPLTKTNTTTNSPITKSFSTVEVTNQSPSVRDRSSKVIESHTDENSSSACPSYIVTQESSHVALCSTKEDLVNGPCEQREFWPEHTTVSISCGIFWKDAKSNSNDDDEKPKGDGETKQICLNGEWSKSERPYILDCKPLCGFADHVEKVASIGSNLKRVLKSPSPWHVGLYQEDILGSNEYRYTCGATLITERALLTAGQCVTLPKQNIERRPSHIKVALGNFKQVLLGVNQTEKLKSIEKIVLHSNYDPNYYESDLAIIWLEDNVQISPFVHPICLPQSHEKVAAGDLGKMVVYRNGTGSDSRLTVIDSESCKQSSGTHKSIVKQDNFCAESNDQDVCTNQYPGAGISSPHRNKHFPNAHNPSWVLDGIRSYGVPTPDYCQHPRPIIFTRVTSFIPWIEFELLREPPNYVKATTTTTPIPRRPTATATTTTTLNKNVYSTTPFSRRNQEQTNPTRRPVYTSTNPTTTAYTTTTKYRAKKPASNDDDVEIIPKSQQNQNNNPSKADSNSKNRNNTMYPQEIEQDAENIYLFERKTKTTSTTTERLGSFQNYDDENNNQRRNIKTSPVRPTAAEPYREEYGYNSELEDTYLRSPIVNVNHQNEQRPNQYKGNSNNQQQQENQNDQDPEKRQIQNSRPRQNSNSTPRSQDESRYVGSEYNREKRPPPTIAFASEEEREESLVFPSVRPTRRSYHCPTPLVTSEGVRLTCTHADREDKDECEDGGREGSKATFECKNHYTHAFSRSRVVRNCTEHGWLPHSSDLSFGCKLDCGISSRPTVSAYIVNGANSDRVRWPFHATIFKRNRNADDDDEDSYTYYCGASLISSNAILTAAHCVTQPRTSVIEDVNEFKVILAAISSNYSLNRRDPHHRKYSVSNISIPEYYNPVRFEGDIAVMILKHDVEFSDFIQPVCFPESNEDYKQKEQNHLVTGSSGYAVGFGYDENKRVSSHLKEITIPYVNPKTCGEALDRYPSVSQFCGGYQNGSSVCNGDSGGGVFFVDESNKYQKKYLISGIISNGDTDKNSKTCNNNNYAVFTKISSFTSFIEDFLSRIKSEKKILKLYNNPK